MKHNKQIIIIIITIIIAMMILLSLSLLSSVLPQGAEPHVGQDRERAGPAGVPYMCTYIHMYIYIYVYTHG